VASVALAVTTTRYVCADAGIDACGGKFDGTALVRGITTCGLPDHPKRRIEASRPTRQHDFADREAGLSYA
jgi:hypothetical protein